MRLAPKALVLCVIWICPMACLAEPRVIFSENFDGAIPAWASDLRSTSTAHQVNFCGPSTEQSASGKTSMKIDVRLGSLTMMAVYRFPMKIPLSAKPKLSAKVWTGKSNTILGINFVSPAQDFASKDWRDFKFGRPKGSGGWDAVVADTAGMAGPDDIYLTALPKDGYLDGFALHLDWGYTNNDGHVVLYVDDIVVTANAPADYEMRFHQLLQTRYGDVMQRMEKERSDLIGQYARRARSLIEPHTNPLPQSEIALQKDSVLQPLEARLRAY